MSAHLTDSGRCSDCGRRQVRLQTDGMGQILDVPDPCVHFRAARPPGEPVQWPPTTKKPEPEAVMPTVEQVNNSAEFRAELRAFVRDNPSVGASEARKAVEEKVGRSVADSTFYREWRAASSAPIPKPEKPAAAPIPPAAEAPKSWSENRTRPAPANGNGAHPPVNRVAADDVAFSEAVHSPVREEIRSLRATYEAGQYVRVEEEDGTWCLRVMLDYPTQAEAMAALGKLLA